MAIVFAYVKFRYFGSMRLCMLCCLLAFSFSSLGQTYWATKVFSASSSFSPKLYKATEALGKPNVFPNHQVNGCSWAPAGNDLSPFIILGFEKALKAKQIAVFINSGAHSFSGIQAILSNGKTIEVNVNEAFPIADSKKILRINLKQPISDLLGLKLRFNTRFSKNILQLDAVGVSESGSPIEAKISQHNQMDAYLTEPFMVTNTSCDELGPIYDSNTGSLLFSRKNCNSNAEGLNPNSGDLYYSKFQDSQWIAAKPLSPRLNTYDDNELYGLSSDGQRLYLSGKSRLEGDRKIKSILLSQKLATGEWADPKPVSIADFYSLDERENTVWVSPDEQVILMSLSREDSYGKTDLYVSLRQPNGQYAAPQHMGPSINSAGFEFAPYLSKDKQILYFSSYGFAGYGGADVYVSKRKGPTWKEWSEPENLGPKVNTEYFEGYFRWLSEPDSFIFSSTRNSRVNYGDFYISKAPTSQAMECLPVPTELIPDSLKTYPQTFRWNMRSEVTQAVKLRIRIGDFILAENETFDSVISVLYAAGHYLVIELQHPYIGFITDTLFTDKPGEKELYLKWCLPGERAILENLLFEYDKDELISGSENNLSFLLDWLRKFPDLRIAVHGHTEPGGNTAYNKRLSTQRAAKVKQYLVERGIAKSRIEIIGHGGKQPIYNTNDPDARQKNRRVEFGILP